MLADIVAKRLARLNIHYGWVIVAVTFVTLLTSAGAMGLPGALILPLNQEFHWDVGSISSALALRLALFGLMGPFSAALIERYGVRNIVITAVLLIVAGLLSALVMTELWQLVVLWGVVVGIGTGMTALVLGAIVSNRWFTAHRGLVLGMLTASSATGQLVFLPLLANLTERLGWRVALAVVCGTLVGAVVGLAQDSLAEHPLGMFGIIKTLVGYFAASVGVRLDVEHPFIRLLLGFFFYVFHQVMFWVMTRALLGKPMSLNLPQVAMEGVLNAIVGVALFLFLDRLRERA